MWPIYIYLNFENNPIKFFSVNFKKLKIKNLGDFYQQLVEFFLWLYVSAIPLHEEAIQVFRVFFFYNLNPSH